MSDLEDIVVDFLQAKMVDAWIACGASNVWGT
jgi:hypothetical protein